MVFLEDQGRLLLVLHAVLGAATVAVSTHFFLWSRNWSAGRGRGPGVRWFAVVAPLVYLAQFTLGNLIYPAYKVRVRAEYLDLPSAVAADADLRDRSRAEIHARAGAAPPAARAEDTLAPSQIARIFDIKEHWAAVGLPLMLAAALLVFAWDPKRDGRAARGLLLFTSGGAAACAWAAALVGLYVTAVRPLP